ncbi:MAG: DUF4197 domain-containing protein [Alphaproteobacteria bacterium]|nr:DUF4197 domain-containing protein [Alphaproteobacteria bacterium]
MRVLLAVLSISILVLSGGDVRAQSFLDKATDFLNKGGQSDLLGGGAGALTEGEIADGLLEALKVGTGRVVDQVSTSGGYLDDSNIHIPLPGPLQTVQKALRPLGMGGLTDDLEVRMNRAAEVAAPEAKAVFLDAISELTLDDAQRIYDGPEDAATRYFQDKTTGRLTERLSPIVDDAMAETGVVKSYNEAVGAYSDIPFTKKVTTDLTAYVVQGALDGLFFYLAREEAAIRQNPAARTTELLQKVFAE